MNAFSGTAFPGLVETQSSSPYHDEMVLRAALYCGHGVMVINVVHYRAASTYDEEAPNGSPSEVSDFRPIPIRAMTNYPTYSFWNGNLIQDIHQTCGDPSGTYLRKIDIHLKSYTTTIETDISSSRGICIQHEHPTSISCTFQRKILVVMLR